jgi:hypothetical protein
MVVSANGKAKDVPCDRVLLFGPIQEHAKLAQTTPATRRLRGRSAASETQLSAPSQKEEHHVCSIPARHSDPERGNELSSAWEGT